MGDEDVEEHRGREMGGHGEKRGHPGEAKPTSSLLEVEASPDEVVRARRENERGKASEESYGGGDARNKAERKTKDEVEGSDRKRMGEERQVKRVMRAKMQGR